MKDWTVSVNDIVLQEPVLSDTTLARDTQLPSHEPDRGSKPRLHVWIRSDQLVSDRRSKRIRDASIGLGSAARSVWRGDGPARRISGSQEMDKPRPSSRAQGADSGKRGKERRELGR
jgi:hypothetical protein